MRQIFLLFLSIIFILPSFSQEDVELTGPISKERILQNCPDWKTKIASYQPDQKTIENLRTINHEIKIVVFLGTWCSDSVRNVSAYFKIMEMVDNPLFRTSYIGIPYDRESRKPFIKGKNIKKVPTFIIYIDNKEKGRIIENPVKSVEEDLLDIIKR